MDFVNILKDSRSVQPFEVRKVPRQEIKYYKVMENKSMKLNLTSNEGEKVNKIGRVVSLRSK